MATGTPSSDFLPNGYYLGLPCKYEQIRTESQILSNACSDAERWNISFITEINKNDVCPAGTYKIALVLDLIDDLTVQNYISNVFLPDYYLVIPDTDYHWYRQNDDGTWSHKPGDGPIQKVDASGEIIYDPQHCNRDYTAINGINYEVFVGYFAVSPLG